MMSLPSTEPSLSTTLSDLAVTLPGAVRVFHRHGLDFCCHGRISLADACQKAALDPMGILEELHAEERSEEQPFERWDERPIEELIDHILARFHEKHREDLPPLVAMAQKVERVHADKPTCPRGLGAFLEEVARSLEEHMQKEEQILFPLLRSSRRAQAAMPVQVMELEHEDHGKNLAKLRAMTNDYTPPEEACTTWRALYRNLAELERELMHHIHLENNVLFPRALRS